MTKSQLTIQSNINRIYIISSISDEELKSAERLVDDLQVLSTASKSPEVRHSKVKNLQELAFTLSTIKKDCESGVVPIIHIECHGNKEDGLRLSEGQFAKWPWIVNRCREINIACQFQLGVVLAACYGLYAISPIKLDCKTPFLFLIAPDKPISAGFIDDKMLPFYRELFESCSFEQALALIEEEFKHFYAEKFLITTLVKYIKKGCMGKGRDIRKEKLISVAFTKGIPNNKTNRRALRKLLKEKITPKPALLHKYAMQFLGKHSSVSFEELMALAKS